MLILCFIHPTTKKIDVLAFRVWSNIALQTGQISFYIKHLKRWNELRFYLVLRLDICGLKTTTLKYLVNTSWLIACLLFFKNYFIIIIFSCSCNLKITVSQNKTGPEWETTSKLMLRLLVNNQNRLQSERAGIEMS